MSTSAFQTDQELETFVSGLPKAELHMHLEGSLEPELMLAIAARNGIDLRWRSAEELRAAYQFTGLQSFLDVYFEGCRVITTEQDFYDLTRAYLRRAHADGVTRAEFFIGPQSFTDRGIDIATLMNGVLRAGRDAEQQDGISSGLVVSVLRNRTDQEALQVLESVLPWGEQIAGFGMGGAEVGNPPSKLAGYFREAQRLGFPTTAHAGEEGPASYVREAMETLKVDRIDHGVTSLTDPGLVRELVARELPLTVCPLSNVKLGVTASLDSHPLPEMLKAGLVATVNSDDPAYFGGYLNDNLVLSAQAMRLSIDDLALLARNSFRASFLAPEAASRQLAAVDEYHDRFVNAAQR